MARQDFMINGKVSTDEPESKCRPSLYSASVQIAKDGLHGTQ